MLMLVIFHLTLKSQNNEETLLVLIKLQSTKSKLMLVFIENYVQNLRLEVM